MNWAPTFAVALPAVVLAIAGSAKAATFAPSCDAASDNKNSAKIISVEVGGSAPMMASVHLSDRNTYHTRADASAGLFTGNVALFTSAYFNKTPVTIHYGCDVGMRVSHFADLP